MKHSLILSILAMGISQAAQAESIVVERGDTLSHIAKSKLGDSTRWKELCQINSSIIRDCNLLVPGTKLKLPENQAAVGGEERPTDLVTAEERSNLVTTPFDLGSDYWSGYWKKPKVDGGVKDPAGGTRLVALRPKMQDHATMALALCVRKGLSRVHTRLAYG